MFDYNTLPEDKRQMRKVELGSGSAKSEKITMDFTEHENVDIAHDLTKPFPFGDEEIEMFNSHHVLEHFNRYTVRDFLKECHRCLKPNGLFAAVIPDFDAAAKQWVANKYHDDWRARQNLMICMLGGQAAGWEPKEGHTHSWGYTPRSAKALMEEMGFEVEKSVAVGPNTDTPIIHLVARKR